MHVNDTFAAGPSGPLDESTRLTLWGASGWTLVAGIRQSESQPRLLLKDDGISWGGGSATADARLYRASAGTLAVENALSIGTTLAVGSSATVAGNGVWHAGNFNPATKSDVGHNHDGYHLKVAGDSIPSGTLGFGSTTRQMLNLWGTQYAMGVQAATSYVRTAQRFSVHAAGTHSNTENDPGSGGSNLLTISSVGSEFKVFGSYRVYHEGFPPPTGGGGSNWSLTLLAWCVARYTTAGGWVVLTGSGVSSLNNRSDINGKWVDVGFTSSLGTANYIAEAQRARSGRDTGYHPGVYLDHSHSTSTVAVIVMSGTGNSEDPNDGDVLSIKFWQRPA